MQNFRAPCLRQLGASPSDPQNSPSIANFWLHACIQFKVNTKNRPKYCSFKPYFLNRTFSFCTKLNKSCHEKLHVKSNNIAKSCKVKFMETA